MDGIVTLIFGLILIDILTNINVAVKMKRAHREVEALVKRVEEWDRQDG